MLCVKGTTKVLGIIGNPIEHSRSPAMQNAALSACGLDYIYIPFKVAPTQLPNAIAGLRALNVAGFNVTIPHKEEIIKYLDGLDNTAEAAGAVNTVVNNEGQLIGHNTDGDGLLKSLKEDLNFKPGNGTTIIVGAGGAARGAVAALCRGGASRIIIMNRNHARAQALVQSLGERYCKTKLLAISDASDLTTYLDSASLVINTTSLGMKNEKISFFNVSQLPVNSMIYDMVYSPPVTPFLNEAKQLGLRCANGLGMLAAQGEFSFQLWTGVMPPPGIMKGALEALISP